MLHYTWLHNGQPLDGPRDNVLRLVNLTVAQAGAYCMAVSNALGVTRSRTVTLHVAPFTGPQATWTAQAPMIDGDPDACWSTAVVCTPTNIMSGTPDQEHHVQFQALWDARALYLLVQMVTPEPLTGCERVWDNDVVELFLEGVNAKGAHYTANDYQYIIAADSVKPVEVRHGAIRSGVVLANRRTATGWRFELRIPFYTFEREFAPGDFLGFEFSAHFQQHVRYGYFNRDNIAWKQPANLGALRLAQLQSAP